MTTDYRPQARNKDLCLLLQALKETLVGYETCRLRRLAATVYQKIAEKF